LRKFLQVIEASPKLQEFVAFLRLNLFIYLFVCLKSTTK